MMYIDAEVWDHSSSPCREHRDSCIPSRNITRRFSETCSANY
jgi:hypothetical protein